MDVTKKTKFNTTTIEYNLKELILQNYSSVKAFATDIDIPYSTIDTILKRGLIKSNILNVIKICDALNISADSLVYGEILFRNDIKYVTLAENSIHSIFRKLNSKGQDELIMYANYILNKSEFVEQSHIDIKNER